MTENNKHANLDTKDIVKPLFQKESQKSVGTKRHRKLLLIQVLA